jgi:hypothetical protein
MVTTGLPLLFILNFYKATLRMYIVWFLQYFLQLVASYDLCQIKPGFKSPSIILREIFKYRFVIR